LCRRRCGIGDELTEACKGILAIAVLASIALRLDDQDTFFRDPSIGTTQDALLDRLR